MKAHRSFSMGALLFVAFCSLADNSSAADLQSDLADQEKLLLSKSQMLETLLAEGEATSELTELLRLAKILRPKSLAPTMAKHVAYSAMFMPSKPTPSEIQYPAYGILLAIGLPAVPDIIAQLKQGTPPGLPPVFGRKGKILLIHCLVDIYQQGGFGKEFARKRLELELKQATEKEKLILQDILTHPSLKE